MKITLKLLVFILINLFYQQPVFSQKSQELTDSLSEKSKFFDKKTRDTLLKGSDTTYRKETPLYNQMAHFPNLATYMFDHLHFSELAQHYGIEGMIYSEIEINTEGKVVSAKIVKGLGFGLDEAVTCMLMAMPKWYPTVKKGVAVNQTALIKVKFNLL